MEGVPGAGPAAAKAKDPYKSKAYVPTKELQYYAVGNISAPTGTTGYHAGVRG